MKNKRLLILSARSKYTWWSCQTIGRNLRAAYERLGKPYVVSTLELSTGSGTNPRYHRSFQRDFVGAIKEFRPDEFVVSDTVPHPLELFKNLLVDRTEEERSSLQYESRAKMRPFLQSLGVADKPWTFHVYGDFTYAARHWLEFGKRENSLGVPLRLVCASPRQQRLVSGFLAGSPEETVSCLPFPVDCKAWSFDEELRSEARKALKVAAASKVILYTGRISLQKNVTALVSEFARLVNEGESNALLWIVGPFDDRDGAIMSLDAPLGYFFKKFSSLLSELPEKVRSKIRVIDPLSGEELRKVYCAADVFASLSLYHDEDFGMAPAEALACGLPAVLSDWGGYSGFAVAGVACEKVPVSLTLEGLLLPSNGVQKALKAALAAARASGAQRKMRGDAFAASFSIDVVAGRLSTVYERTAVPFQGFNARYKHLGDRVSIGRPHPDFFPSSGTLYEEVYRPYFEEQRG